MRRRDSKTLKKAIYKKWTEGSDPASVRGYLNGWHVENTVISIRDKLAESKSLSDDECLILDSLLFCFLRRVGPKGPKRFRGQARTGDRWRLLAMMDLLVKENRASRKAAAAAVLPNEGPMGWKSLVRTYQKLKKHPADREIAILESDLEDARARLPVKIRK